MIGSWSNHYNSWETYKSCEVLIVKYEEMLSDPVGTFSKILKYFNKIDDVKIDSEKFKKSLEQTEFKELQKMEKIQGFAEKGKSDLFFREGKIGSWKKDVDFKIIKRIEKIFK